MKDCKLILFLIVFLVSSCSTITINPETSNKLESSPAYEETKSFYWWGLSGEYRVDVKEVCKGSEAQQMQTQMTFENGLFTVITLGIYAPHTIKVWCK